tara:strand:- start:68 stop:643 length:576 start_codon:yes stop_codon:yes gene_type:complete
MIEHIFPSPLYYSQVRNNNKIKYHIDRCIDNVEFTKKKEWSSPHWLAPSDFNSNILKDLGIHSLLDEIDYHIEEYCNELSFKKRPYQILSWFSKFTRDDYAIEHNHNDADISGVYYYQTKEDAPEIYFTSPNPYLDTTQCYKPKGNITWKHSPTEGKILLFPGWLKHGVHRNNSDDIRISISFNIFFKSQR